jgi:hypothetical protein
MHENYTNMNFQIENNKFIEDELFSMKRFSFYIKILMIFATK